MGEIDWEEGPVHPSDYHADCAVGDLIASQTPERDTLERDRLLRSADIHAKLALRDAVLEAVAIFREKAAEQIESAGELSATMKRAANAIHSAVRRTQVKEAS